MLTQKELLERALKGLAKLTQNAGATEDAKAPTGAQSLGDHESLTALEPTINEFGKHFEITGVRVAGPKDRGILYAEWKAGELNRIFAQHGAGGVGRITSRTVQHGLTKHAARVSATDFKPDCGGAGTR